MLKWIITHGYLLLPVLILIAVLVILQRNWKKRQEEKARRDKRLKDQILAEALKNSRGKRSSFGGKGKAEPLDLNQDPQKNIKGVIVVQMTMGGNKAERYAMNPEDHILLGAAEGMNDIVLQDSNIAQQQCDIFMYQEQVYVRNLNSSYPMGLKRGNQRTPVGDRGIRILTGDTLWLGSCQIRIALMDYAGNTM